jgi:predicted ferric reductase
MRSLKGKIGVWVIGLLTVFPVIVWLFMKPIDVRFESTFMTWTSIGQFSGIVGSTFFSLALILSARLHFFEEYFGGLDRMYNMHHKIGVIAFLTLLVHPLTLAFRYMELSYSDAAFFLLPSADWGKNFGIISLMLLMVLLSVTFYAKWRYQILKFIHQILGVVFFFGVLHMVFITSDYTNSVILETYMIGLAFIALFAYTYRTNFGSITITRFQYTVKAVNRLDATVTEIVMVPNGERMHYMPGQFIFISFIDGGLEKETHPFSISSAPADPLLRITVKALGDYTKSIQNLQIGATAKVEGPFGAFNYLYAENARQIWIAGGIGITPFLNMARNIRTNMHTGHVVDFYYSTKSRAEMIFFAELEAISKEYPNLRIIPFCAEERGFLTADAVEKESGGLLGKDIFVCGPPPMMRSIIDQCRIKGVPNALIHAEEFKLL